MAMDFTLSDADRALITLALTEDLGDPAHDLTAETLFADHDFHGHVVLRCKEANGILFCGTPVIHTLIEMIDPKIEAQFYFADGIAVPPGADILSLEGAAYSLSRLERLMLNFVRHLSAIATLTRQYVDAIAHTQARVLDTRKTTPGMRHLEKYAVTCGGGVNHRMGLYDAIMIKDTHVDMLGGMEKALATLPAEPTVPVIVEVRNEAELDAVLAQTHTRITRALLDNMPPELLVKCVDRSRGKLETEASGNIRLDTVRTIAETGVDYVSVGALTYSAGQVDLSLIESIYSAYLDATRNVSRVMDLRLNFGRAHGVYK